MGVSNPTDFLKGLGKGSPGTIQFPDVGKLPRNCKNVSRSWDLPVAPSLGRFLQPLTPWTQFSLCFAALVIRVYALGRPKIVISVRFPESAVSTLFLRFRLL